MRWSLEAILGAAPASARPRVLVLAAHPDDETLGAAGLLQRLADRRLPLAVAHLTDGAPADMVDAREHGFTCTRDYAIERWRELTRALRCLPCPVDTFAAGFQDQTLSYQLPAAVQAVSQLIDAWAPSVIISHPYEGGHPDHDGAAFAVSVALGVRRDAPGRPAPLHVEFTSYHLWNGTIRAGTFLPGSERGYLTLPLDRKEHAGKRRMLQCFDTQQRTLGQFGVSDEEHFRLAPGYDFRQPPHAGTLLYELYPWGTDGAAWRNRAAAVLDHVGALCR
jgi:LmbE family N-acetylglucosaminyl deacetylase